MALVLWILIGVAAGIIKRRILPGRPGGLMPTLVLAAIGALIGGYVATYFTSGELGTLHAVGLAAALIGAVLMLLVSVKLRI
ncbi:hypothetical protein LU196_02335 [Pantoea sp. Mb-10]|uniref:GlsB/YeaQ/YmgE family stress response membrane protein n=1 Tax=unclassified Pantoea TaxID=2630326 RepID=UPI001E4C3BEA|nr:MULTISPECIES: hypothetical protein [unclassified Pantoea]MCE0488895.1 hypothetical protein [Pantoea sp. Mb-10]MCE0500642.1 hypothetical protein [Pantoea sp. Pb-8]